MLLGITANTVRKMIPGRYNQNYIAFNYIIKYCKAGKIPLFIYIPPIRDDVSIPYNIEEYNNFKKTIEADVKSYGHYIINIEHLVPARYWGMKKSTNSFIGKGEVDFMHFQEAGHKLLADTIYAFLSERK